MKDVSSWAIIRVTPKDLYQHEMKNRATMQTPTVLINYNNNI